MNDFSKLVESFDTLDTDLAQLSEQTGAKLVKLDTPMYRPGPAPAVEGKIRSGMFKMLASSSDRRLSFQHRRTRWPLVPQHSCNVGFLVSPTGYGIGYFAGCGCLSSFLEDPDNFRALMIDSAGEYFPVSGRPCQHADGEFIRLGASNGYLVKFEIPSGVSIPGIQLGDVRSPGEAVYSLGINEFAWVLSEGVCLPAASDDELIHTTCDCFHGFCGAPLFTGDGTIVGLGARIRFDEEASDDAIPNREYGYSTFDRLTHILRDIPPEVSRQLRWRED